MRMTAEEKLRAVLEYMDDSSSITSICKKYRKNKSDIQYWINLYKRFGEAPFTGLQAKRVYSREEKLKAIKEVMSGRVSGRQKALELGSPNPDVVNDWIDLYRERGESAVQQSRGRKKYMLHEDRQRYLADKELRARIEFLEAENDYLKKSYSLIQEKNRQSKKK